jgi:hypothetical protein
MNIKNRIGLAVAMLSLTTTSATATPQLSQTPATPTSTLTDKEKLEIDNQVQEEVDRAFNHTTALMNILLVVLTMLPILAAAGVWLLRRSVISEVVAETKKRLEEEVEKQLEKEVAAELKNQTAAFKQELEVLKADFLTQLSQLNNLYLDAQSQRANFATAIRTNTFPFINPRLCPSRNSAKNSRFDHPIRNFKI